MIEIDGLFFPELMDDYFNFNPIFIKIKLDMTEFNKVITQATVRAKILGDKIKNAPAILF